MLAAGLHLRRYEPGMAASLHLGRHAVVGIRIDPEVFEGRRRKLARSPVRVDDLLPKIVLAFSNPAQLGNRSVRSLV
jgi:hypothetical protein